MPLNVTETGLATESPKKKHGARYEWLTVTITTSIQIVDRAQPACGYLQEVGDLPVLKVEDLRPTVSVSLH